MYNPVSRITNDVDTMSIGSLEPYAEYWESMLRLTPELTEESVNMSSFRHTLLTDISEGAQFKF
jgi:hypothetical protein